MSKAEAEKTLPRLVVFASGTRAGGGTGFEEVAVRAKSGELQAELVGVVSNHAEGGVRQRADRLNVPFRLLDKSFSGEDYEECVRELRGEWCLLSGWLKLVVMKTITSNGKTEGVGLDPRRTINIHPGPLPGFGGAGMYGKFVHEAVLKSYRNSNIGETGPTMHFVTEAFDDGPIIFYKGVPLEDSDDADSVQQKVQKIEKQFQWWVTDLVVRGQISWDGRDSQSLELPPDYPYLPKSPAEPSTAVRNP